MSDLLERYNRIKKEGGATSAADPAERYKQIKYASDPEYRAKVDAEEEARRQAETRRREESAQREWQDQADAAAEATKAAKSEQTKSWFERLGADAWNVLKYAPPVITANLISGGKIWDDASANAEKAHEKYAEAAKSTGAAKEVSDFYEQYPTIEGYLDAVDLRNKTADLQKSYTEEAGKAAWEEIKSNYEDLPVFFNGRKYYDTGNSEAAGMDYGEFTKWKQTAPSDAWSDEEKYRYAYLKENGGDWETYARELNLDYASESREKERKEREEFASTPVGGVLTTAESVVLGGLYGLGDYLNQLVYPGMKDYNEHLSMFDANQAGVSKIASDLNGAGGTIDESVPIFGGKGLGDAYQLGNSILQSALVGFATGGAGNVGKVLTFINFFGQASAAGINEAKAKGATDDEALAYGTLAGVFEGLFEEISLDKVIKINESPAVFKELIKNSLKSAGIEASEEAATTMANKISDAIILGEKSDLAKETLLKNIEDIIFDAVGGAVSGGVHSVAFMGANYVAQNSQKGSAIKSSGSADMLEKYARQYGTLEDGKNMPKTSVGLGSLATRTEKKMLEDFGKNIGLETSAISALTDGYKTQYDVSEYAEEFLKYYDAGKNGAEMPNIDGIMGKDLGKIAYNEGRIAAIEEEETAETRIEGVKNLFAYSDGERASIESNKNFSVAKSLDDILNFVNAQKSNIENNAKTLFVGKISKKTSEFVKSQTGISIENKSIALNGYDIRHIINRHGNQSTENLRGQVAIETSDFKTIIETITDPDRVTANKNEKGGVTTLTFQKEMSGKTTAVTVLSEKKNTLTLKTAWINKNGRHISQTTNAEALISTPEARPSMNTVHNDIIPENGKNVKENSKIFKAGNIGAAFKGETRDLYESGNAGSADYSAAFSEAYKNGYLGRGAGTSFDGIRAKYGEDVISDTQIDEAYQAGADDRAAQRGEIRRGSGKVELNGAKVTSEERDMLRELAAFGQIDIKFADLEGANGTYKDGVIYIDKNAENPVAVVLGHEGYHRFREAAPAQAAIIERIAYEAAEKADKYIAEKTIARYAEAGQMITYADAIEEIAADYIGDAVGTPENFRQIIKQASTQKEKSAVGRLFDKIRELWNRVKAKFTGEKYEKAVSDADKAIAALEKMMYSAKIGIEAEAETASEGGEKLSVKEGDGIDENLLDFVESVLSMTDKTKIQKRKYVLGTVSESHANIINGILKSEIGETMDVLGYKIVIDGSAIEHIEERHGKNGVSDHSMQNISDFARIGWAANNAENGYIARKKNGEIDTDRQFKNSDGSNSVKIILEKAINDKKMLIAECVPDSILRQIHIISARIEKSGTNQVLNVDKSAQPTSETMLGDRVTTHSISQKDEKSRGNSSLKEKNVTQTTEFKRWFGDSKVVNEDGTPKVMYHGTASDFWAFDIRKSNDKAGRLMGLGAGKDKIYLTEYEAGARAAASGAAARTRGGSERVMPLYVSAKKVMERAEYNELLKSAYEKYPGSNPREEGYDYTQRDKAIRDIDRQIQNQGYDAVFDKESGELFVFNPTQIKSATDNIGTFDGSNSDIRYSLKKTKNIPYSEQLQMIEKEELSRSDSLYVGTPRQNMQNAGFSSAPFAMNQSDYRKSRRESGNNKHYSSHGVSFDFFEKMPDKIDSAPILIDNGEKITVITDYPMNDKQNEASYVIVGVLRDQPMENDVVNQIKSVYPLDDIADKIKEYADSGKIVIINKNRAEKLLTTVGLQLSEVSSILDSAKSIISQNSDLSRGKIKNSLKTTDAEKRVAELAEELERMRQSWSENGEFTGSLLPSETQLKKTVDVLMDGYSGEKTKKALTAELRELFGDIRKYRDAKTTGYKDKLWKAISPKIDRIAADLCNGRLYAQTVKISADSELAQRLKESDGKNKYKIIEEYLKEKLGGREFTLSDGRVAVMDNRDANKLASKSDETKVAVLSEIEQIIKNAEYFGEATDVEHDKFNAFYYYALNVELDGKKFGIWLNIGKAKNDGTNHIYAVTNKKESPTKSEWSPAASRVSRNGSFNNSISQKDETVKGLGGIEQYSDNLYHAVLAQKFELMYSLFEMPNFVAADFKDGTNVNKLYEKIKELRTEKEAALEKVREQRRKTVKALKLAETTDADIDQKFYESEARKKLLRVAKRLSSIKYVNREMTVEGQKVNVGDFIDRAIHDVLDGVKSIRELDLVSVSMRSSTKEFLEDLSSWYSEQKNDANFYGDDRTEKELARLSKLSIGQMTIRDVEALTDALLNVENTIRTQNKMIDSEDKRNFQEQGAVVINDVNHLAGINKGLWDDIVTESLSPLRAVSRITGYNDGDPLMMRTRELNDGQRNMLAWIVKYKAAFNEYTSDTEYMKKLTGKNADIVMRSGDGIMTRGMLMSLYLHSTNAQNMKHVELGGAVLPNGELYKEGKIRDAYAKKTILKMSRGQIVKLANEQLSEKDFKFITAVKRYFNVEAKAGINEVSNKLLGYDLAKVGEYFPISVNGAFTKAEYEQIKCDGSVAGMGNLKERVDSSLPIDLVDVTTVLNRAIDLNAKYIGLAVPVRNMSKLLRIAKVQSGTDANGATVLEKVLGGDGFEHYIYDTSVMDAIEKKWGKNGADYIKNMLADVQGLNIKDRNTFTDLFDGLRSNYAQAVLTINPAVALKQTASYPTAAAVIGWKALLKGLDTKRHVNLDVVSKYTPLLAYRSLGYTDADLGAIVNRRGRLPKGLNWIQTMDVLTTKRLWAACEYYVEERNPSLERRSDEYYKAVAEVYNRVIEETQPNYTAMQRPQLLRSNDTLLKNLAMFKTQPMQNLNLIFDAIGNYRAKNAMYTQNPTAENSAALKEAKARLGRVVASQIVQAVMMAAITLGWNAARGKLGRYKDEDDETIFNGKGFARFIIDVVENLGSGIPFASEVTSFAESIAGIFSEGKFTYYGIEAATPAMISDMLEGVGNFLVQLTRVVEGNAKTEKVISATENAASEIAKVFGIPVGNVINMMKIIFRIFGVEWDK